MLFRQFFDTTSSTYTYLLAQDYGREAVIIDPVTEHIPLYKKMIDEMGLKPKLILDTHVHADHITATGKLSQHYQCDVGGGEFSKADCITKKFKDGEIFEIDSLKLTAIHTPGHTDDSFCYAYKNMLFTGDTLLIRGTGRTDFQNGDPYLQYESIFNKLFKYPDATLVYPAHDYKGATVSTIGEEKKFNPRLQVNNADEYADIMNNLNLSKPKLIDVAVPANLNCGLDGSK